MLTHSFVHALLSFVTGFEVKKQQKLTLKESIVEYAPLTKLSSFEITAERKQRLINFYKPDSIQGEASLHVFTWAQGSVGQELSRAHGFLV